jgi:L-rhamnose mutarotase
MFSVIFGFLGIVLSLILILLVLNYSVYLWESNKINDLTSKIKSEHDDYIPDFLGKNNASRGFTTRDLNENISKNRSISSIKPEDRKVIFVDDKAESAWLKSITSFFHKFRVNFWAQIRSIYRYLIHLARPDGIKVKSTTPEDKAQITEVIQKVKEADQDETTNIHEINDNQVVVINAKKSLVNEDDDLEAKELKDLELFEKMENKLLAKLKEVGMKHFDIWLDLGKLYEKYEYKEKATEIYSMILKSSDGKEKEMAKDRLIEIN